MTLADEQMELFALEIGAEILLVEPGQQEEVELQALFDDTTTTTRSRSSRARRSSPSWATSTTARPRCSTRSARANVVAGEAGGITQHIGAYQVEQRRPVDHVHRHAGPRGVHADAGPRRRGDRHRRAGGRRRRRRDAPDDRGDQPRPRGRGADRRGGQQDRQGQRRPAARAHASSPSTGSCPSRGAATRSSSRCRPPRTSASTTCSTSCSSSPSSRTSRPTRPAGPRASCSRPTSTWAAARWPPCSSTRASSRSATRSWPVRRGAGSGR